MDVAADSGRSPDWDSRVLLSMSNRDGVRCSLVALAGMADLYL
jgi:hypothetical protein